MKKQLIGFAALALLAGFATGAAAQDMQDTPAVEDGASAWTYELIYPGNDTKITFEAPRDLTYPPAGARLPVISSRSQAMAGVPETLQQLAERVNAPTLIITTLPPGQAQHIMSGGRY